MVRSAAYRIAIVSSLAFALATCVLGLVVYLAAHAALAGQLDDRIREDNTTLVNEYRREGRIGLFEAIAGRERQSGSNELGYAVFDTKGNRIAGNLMTEMPEPGLRNIVFRDPEEGADPARAFTRLLPDGSRLVVAADREPLERIDQVIVTLFVAAFLGVLVIGAAGAIILGAYLRYRLSAMNVTAEAIMAGDLDQRVPVGRRGDEFDRLARLLNAMLNRIADLLENLRQVSSDVAHDLRTPLARLRNGLENGLRHDLPRDQRDKAIEQAIARSDEVLSLFAALLRLSEIEAGRLQQAFAPVDLAQLVRETGESYALAIEDGGRALDCNLVKTAIVLGDRELLAQALINLLDNAQIHTPPGTHIDMTLKAAADRVVLTVADDGPGVRKEDRVRLTRRFARADASRSRPGHGLGLSLVAAIAGIHHARLKITDNHPGLAVMLDFPSVRS